MKRLLNIAVLLLFLSGAAFAEYNQVGIVDSSEIRAALIETWFYAPLKKVLNNTPEIRVNNVGDKFQVYAEEKGDYVCIYVAPRASIMMDVYSDRGHKTESYDIFPPDAEGSWVLYRAKRTGESVFIRYYPTKESDVYLQFFPDKIDPLSHEAANTKVDVICYNTYLRTSVPIGLPFERFYDASLTEVRQWTAKTLPWEFMELHLESYQDAMQMVGMIKSKLPSIIMTPDAMYDEDGRAVFVSTGEERVKEKRVEGNIYVDGAGFVKWIADGIIEPLTGSLLNRTPLLVETVHYSQTGYQGIIAKKYNINFTLDWIRNIASAIISIRTEKNYMADESGCDVTFSPFACVIDERGVKNSFPYISDTGYSMEVLKPLLYTLAIKESDTFFFGAISTIDRKTPEVKVFNDCCVLFPYFDKDEHFKCVIFKDGKEVTIENLCKQFKGQFISLTRSRATKNFFPN